MKQRERERVKSWFWGIAIAGFIMAMIDVIWGNEEWIVEIRKIVITIGTVCAYGGLVELWSQEHIERKIKEEEERLKQEKR